MINIEFECKEGHRFTGSFKDYTAFKHQGISKMIRCPVCETPEIKRIYTGCSIQAKAFPIKKKSSHEITLYEQAVKFNKFIRENFVFVENGFSDMARAMHYGIEDEKNIYGNATADEICELNDEGISVFPLIDPEKRFN